MSNPLDSVTRTVNSLLTALKMPEIGRAHV